MKKWDVVIVGAGPAGAFAAYRLAHSGLRVLLLEEHKVIGLPRHCTGILGKEAYDRFPNLPRQMIHRELDAAWIVSPSGEKVRTLWFSKQAYVIQRAHFDQALCAMAVRAGAELQMSSTVKTINVLPQEVLLGISREEGREEVLHASTVVLATGISYRLHEQLGLKPPSAHLHCAQMEVDSDQINEVEVYIGHHVAPGSFAWAVPVGNGHVRLGVTAHRKASYHLEALLEMPMIKERIRRNGQDIVKRPVPIRPIDCSVQNRVLLVGDAAGQVKPTTGGGIYYGILGAELAAQTLEQAFSQGCFDRWFLMAYDQRWKQELNQELWMGRFSRAVFERFSDAKLDRLVRVCRHQKIISLVNQSAHFDWHGRALLSFLTAPRVLGQLF